MKLHDQFIITL